MLSILSISNAHNNMVMRPVRVYILQRGVQWKQGVVIYMTLYTSSLYDITSIHCTPLPLHPPLLSIQVRATAAAERLRHK